MNRWTWTNFFLFINVPKKVCLKKYEKQEEIDVPTILKHINTLTYRQTYNSTLNNNTVTNKHIKAE